MWCFFFHVLWLKNQKSGEVEGEGHGRNIIFFGGGLGEFVAPAGFY